MQAPCGFWCCLLECCCSSSAPTWPICCCPAPWFGNASRPCAGDWERQERGCSDSIWSRAEFWRFWEEEPVLHSGVSWREAYIWSLSLAATRAACLTVVVYRVGPLHSCCLASETNG